MTDGTDAGTAASARRSLRRTFTGALLLVAAVLVAYRGALEVGFLHDDEAAIQRNETLGPPLELGRALRPPRDTTVAGRPVLNLSFALDRALFGPEARGHHMTNVALHALAAVLLFLFVRRSLRSPRLGEATRARAGGLALLAALVWAVHPLNTQAVTYLAQRAESLMGLFLLATLWAAARAGGERGRRAAAFGALAVAACALGMGTKETMVVAPLVVVAWDLCFLEGAPRAVARRRAALWAGLAATWIPLALLVAGDPRPSSVGGALGVGPLDYFRTQLSVLAHYLRLAVWPAPLVFDYEWPTTGGWGAALLPGLLLVALGVATLVGLGRRRPWGFVGAVFFLVLGPTSSFLPIVTEVAAEHRMFVPLAALVAGVVVGGAVLLSRAAPERPVALRVGAGVAVAVALVFATMTAARNRLYRDPLALWEQVLAERPDNSRAELSLGVHLAQVGRDEEAYAHCERAMRLGAPPWETRKNLGSLALRLARPAEAAEHLAAALALRPDDPSTEGQLGIALARAGRGTEAEPHLRTALAAFPERATYHDHLAEALASAGRLPEAVEHLERAAALEPGSAAVQAKLARGLLFVRRDAEARAALEQAVALDPATPVAVDLAWMLAAHPDQELRDGARALALAEALVARAPGALQPAVALAAAEAELGRFDEAAARLGALLEAARAQGAPDDVLAPLEAARAEVAAGRPWRRRRIPGGSGGP